MPTQNEIYGARPESRPPPAYVPGQPVDERREVAPRRTGSVEAQVGGASLEVIGGAGAGVLGILGLLGYCPATFAKIAAIAVGAALLIHGIATTARWRNAYRRAGQGHVAQAGIGSEAVGGAAGAVLGIATVAELLRYYRERASAPPVIVEPDRDHVADVLETCDALATA
jgi:hypothetical protein